MEDKNFEPLVPDMLYRHVLEEEPQPEALMAEAMLPLSEVGDDIPLPEEALTEEPAPAEVVTEDTVAGEFSAGDAAADMSAGDTLLFPIIPEDAVQTVSPAAEEEEAIPLDAYVPNVELPFEEEASVPGDGIPLPLSDDTFVNAPATDDTVVWDADAIIAEAEGYTTVEPESAPAGTLPEAQQPEFTDMKIEKTKEKKPIPANKKRAEPEVKKGRPKRKKGPGLLGLPHLVATLIWLGIIVMIGSSLGKLLWVGAADVLAFGRENKVVTVTIVDSDTIDTIAIKLQEVGLVKYPQLFKFYADLTGAEEEITTGSFTLNTNLDYHALTNALSPSSSNRAVVKVTIPEGYSCRQVFQLLASSNVCSVEALEEYAANGELPEYWFLEGVERGDRYCLEGYLFPDTYEFYANSTPKEALSRMLSGFNVRFSEEMRAQVDTLNQQLSDLMRKNGKSEEYIAGHLFTVREVMIVASLVEKETAGSGESPTIASVIYNRLYNWGDTPAYLNIDASIYYALDGNIDPATGNTKVLTSDDMKVDSPFNTYKYPGLTPTPITNPGLSSIQAALTPQSTGYYYYVLNPETNVHQFSKTLEEHEKWVAKFYPKSED